MTTIKLNPKDIKGIECKFTTYQKAVDGSNDDMLLVKEVIHTHDGRQIPRIKLRENWERDFYITKPNYRNHQDKKEYEDEEKLDKFSSTQANLAIEIQKRLYPWRAPDPKKQLRDVCTNQYVYFADMTTPTLIKAKYRERWPDLISRNKVAILDIETNVVDEEHKDEPILVTVTMGEHKIVGLVRYYADKIIDCENTIHKKYADYLSDIEIRDKETKEMLPRNLLEERGKNLKIHIAETAGEVVAKVMADVHKLHPDFLAIWNMNFDIPKIIRALEKANIPLEDVFCDPCVPDKYRKVWYKEAKAQRETNSKVISQHPADLWHVLYCQAGFYCIDAMCLFKKIRTANGNEPSYALDPILKRYLGVGKLKFSEVPGDGDLRWHIGMQRDYPAEYVIYNIFDCISIELLDEQTNDLGMTVSALADISEMSIFPSLPKRLVDILTYFYLDRGKVPGCVGSDVVSELDEEVISLGGWIVTLPAHMVAETGLNCIEEIPELKTMFRVQVADDDLTQAYPTGGLVMNISKETTHIELCSIDGVEEAARRRSGINLTGGETNAIEICNELMNMPYIDDVLEAFQQDIKEGKVA